MNKHSSRKQYLFATSGLLLLLIGVSIWTYVNRSRNMDDHSSSQPLLKFQGKVIDQSRRPISGAEVVIQVSRMVNNPIIPGGTIADQLPKNRFSVYSGAQGMFYVMMQPPNHVLEILEIKKRGYQWVIDWAWTLGPPYNQGDNRLYKWAGKLYKCPTYAIEADWPAIYPMQQIGNDSPATQPSRGGKDILCDHTERKNEPTPLHVPSAGANAPQTPEEIDLRLKQYLDQIGIPQPALHTENKP